MTPSKRVKSLFGNNKGISTWHRSHRSKRGRRSPKPWERPFALLLRKRKEQVTAKEIERELHDDKKASW